MEAKKSLSCIVLGLLGLTGEPEPGHGDTLSEQQAARRRMGVRDENVKRSRNALQATPTRV